MVSPLFDDSFEGSSPLNVDNYDDEEYEEDMYDEDSFEDDQNILPPVFLIEPEDTYASKNIPAKIKCKVFHAVQVSLKSLVLLNKSQSIDNEV